MKIDLTLPKEAENPNSYLNQGPKPKFASRYADPNHPASSGDLFALLTGGIISKDDGENDSIIHQVIKTGSKMLESVRLSRFLPPTTSY